jgi:hypothetical protein
VDAEKSRVASSITQFMACEGLFSVDPTMFYKSDVNFCPNTISFLICVDVAIMGLVLLILSLKTEIF